MAASNVWRTRHYYALDIDQKVDVFENIEDIESVNVNWDKETVFVKTVNQEEKVDWKEKLSKLLNLEKNSFIITSV